MYAVIKTGGKQYRVKEGDLLKIEQIEGDVGSEVKFSEVLLMVKDDKVTCGTPLIDNIAVNAQIVSHGRHRKIRIIKFRRRKHHMKRMGHRQNYTEVKIKAIG